MDTSLPSRFAQPAGQLRVTLERAMHRLEPLDRRGGDIPVRDDADLEGAIARGVDFTGDRIVVAMEHPPKYASGLRRWSLHDGRTQRNIDATAGTAGYSRDGALVILRARAAGGFSPTQL